MQHLIVSVSDTPSSSPQLHSFPPFIRLHQTAYRFDKDRLARTVPADNAAALTFLKRNIHVLQYADSTPLKDSARLQKGFSHDRVQVSK